MKLIFKIFIYKFFILNISYAYVIGKSESGRNLHWHSDLNYIPLKISTKSSGTNSIGLTTSNITTIFNAAITEWNNASKLKISTQYTQSLPAVGLANTLRFSSNGKYFGSGVLAITALQYSSKTGEIYSGDILINETLFAPSTLTSSPALSSGGYAYLGDVVTHELGHLFGLSHSDAVGSSMNFTIFKGQSTLSKDDKMAVKMLYHDNHGRILKGTVKGMGGISLFGVNVQLYTAQGELIASVFSDEDGRFSFNNLAENDYIIYLSPVKNLDVYSDYYASIKNEFCSGQSYKASFVQKCGNSSKGHPQIYNVSNELDIGNVTVSCNYNFDPGYLLAKNSGFLAPYSIVKIDDGEIMNNHILGVFYNSDVGDPTKIEKHEIDLTGFDTNLRTDLFANINIIVEEFGTMLDLTADLRRTDEIVETTFSSSLDASNARKILNLNIKYPLSDQSADNKIFLNLVADALTSAQETEILGAPNLFKNSILQYLLTVEITDSVGNKLSTNQNQIVEDNTSCLEGNTSFNVRGVISETRSVASSDEEQNLGVACGTIDDNNDGGGAYSFLLGLCLILTCYYLQQKSSKFLS